MKTKQKIEEEESLKLFNIALVGGSIKEGRIQYYASDEEDCKKQFLENNPDLEESDIWVEKQK